MSKKVLIPLLAAISLFAATTFSSNKSFYNAKAEETINSIRLSTYDTVTEGNQYSASVYLRTYEEISALAVDVYFDSSTFEIKSAYNSISAKIYDSSIHENHLSFTYIFDDIDTSSEKTLFYFYYRVKDGIVPDEYYFDVIINEAYNSPLENVEIVSSRKYVSVASKPVNKSANIYVNGISDISTSIGNTFSLNYAINTPDVAGGTFVVHYDDELFSFSSIEQGDFFDNKMFDYNGDTSGEIYISFAAVSQNYNTNLFLITFETISNVTATSNITIAASSLYDYDLVDMTLTCQTANINVTFDSSFSDAPKMLTLYSVDTSNNLVFITISLESNSHLGAGDFVFRFDKDILTYVNCEKKISPTFFTVNDKEQQLNQGQIKFSILSTTDIVEASNIIVFTFSYLNTPTQISLSTFLFGSGVTDSLTNPIELDIQGIEVTIPATDYIIRWAVVYLYMGDESFNGNGTGRCLSEGLYVVAKRELLKLDDNLVESFVQNADNKYTNQLARYLSWAQACGDISPFEGDGIIVSNGSSIINVAGNSSFVVMIALAASIFPFLFVATAKAKRKRYK